MGAPNSSKPPGQAGISGATTNDQLKSRVEVLEKFIKEYFDEKNQWNSMLRDWVGTEVHVRFISGDPFFGTLRWVDRYTLCVDDDGHPTIIHKAAIATIAQHKPAA